MRVVETCKCGASIEVVYSLKHEYPYRDEPGEEAKEQLRIFRETHAHHNAEKAS